MSTKVTSLSFSLSVFCYSNGSNIRLDDNV